MSSPSVHSLDSSGLKLSRTIREPHREHPAGSNAADRATRARWDINGKKHIVIDDTSAELDIVVYDTSPSSQAVTSLSTLTLTFQAVAPTTGDIFADAQDQDTLANGAPASDFSASADLDIVTDSGNKQANAAWAFNGNFENLNSGKWTFTASLATTKGSAQRTFTFDPEIDINM